MAKRKVSIRIYSDKVGRRRAEYWIGMRWQIIAMTLANMMLANGDGKLVDVPTQSARSLVAA